MTSGLLQNENKLHYNNLVFELSLALQCSFPLYYTKKTKPKKTSNLGDTQNSPILIPVRRHKIGGKIRLNILIHFLSVKTKRIRI